MALTKEMVRKKMKEKNVVVLNVLSEVDYQKLHIKGSHNLPLNHDLPGFVEKTGMKYGRDKFIITHCTNYLCAAGPNAAKALKDAGFKAEDYPGGIEEWFEAGFPTEGTQAKVAVASK